MDTWAKHERARNEEERRQRMAAALQGIRIAVAGEQPTPDGHQAIVLDVCNGTTAPISQLAIDVQYLSGQQLLATDNSCRQAVNVPPGQTARFGCYLRQVPGATGVQPQIVDVRWR